MWPNMQKTADLVTFTEEILNGKLFCAVMLAFQYFSQKIILIDVWQSPEYNSSEAILQRYS